jgi:hypothetical protein
MGICIDATFFFSCGVRTGIYADNVTCESPTRGFGCLEASIPSILLYAARHLAYIPFVSFGTTGRRRASRPRAGDSFALADVVVGPSRTHVPGSSLCTH